MHIEVIYSWPNEVRHLNCSTLKFFVLVFYVQADSVELFGFICWKTGFRLCFRDYFLNISFLFSLKRSSFDESSSDILAHFMILSGK